MVTKKEFEQRTCYSCRYHINFHIGLLYGDSGSLQCGLDSSKPRKRFPADSDPCSKWVLETRLSDGCSWCYEIIHGRPKPVCVELSFDF